MLFCDEERYFRNISIFILEGGKKALEDLSLDELDLVEDEEDERVLLEYRLVLRTKFSNL